MIESRRSPDQFGSTRLMSILRASGPSIPSMKSAKPSQPNIATQRCSAAAISDMKARKAPLAVRRWTPKARHLSKAVIVSGMGLEE